MGRVRTRPLVLIIRDGWGANPDPAQNGTNAVHLARTPVNDRLMATYPHVLIQTSGNAVGLPEGIMGNSEVGHQNIGAGRVVLQELMRISDAIRDESFFRNPVLIEVMDGVRDTGGRLHLLGLCSDGGVHSALDHLDALVRLSRRRGVDPQRVFVHAFTDGRDTSPTSGIDFLQQIEARMAEVGAGRVATVCGRYYAMDRDNRWERIEGAYRMLTEGEGRRAGSARQAIAYYYDHPSEPSRAGDEFIEPTVITDDGATPRAVVADGDSVVFFNFRGDRPRQLVKALVCDPFPLVETDRDGRQVTRGFARKRQLDLRLVTMTGYESGLPVNIAFDKPPKMSNILGAYLSDLGLRQFRCAETEKYAHVTFFFNDYREEPFAGEDRALIPSPRDITTYDQRPEMSARPLTEEVVRRIADGVYDFMVINYANGDMVGHTGNLPAAVTAVETVDACVGRVVEATRARGGSLIVTADHGNAEMMVDPQSGCPHTAHTTFDVELIVVNNEYCGRSLRTGGMLADVVPTALDMMGLDVPAEMTGRSLL